MYNSLPWEEDITRVYELRSVSTRSSEGIFLFPYKKGDIWCSVEAPGVGCIHFFPRMHVWIYICIGVEETERTK